MNGLDISGELMVLSNYIYEYKKGVRPLVLYTMNKGYELVATNKLKNQGIPYFLQEVGSGAVNIYFGNQSCLDTISMIVNKPLSKLSPEEDFILGALLGYDLRMQCERFCARKTKSDAMVI